MVKVFYDSTLFELTLKKCIERYIKRLGLASIFLIIFPSLFSACAKILVYLIDSILRLANKVQLDLCFEKSYNDFIGLIQSINQYESSGKIFIILIAIALSRLCIYYIQLKRNLILNITWLLYCGLIGYLSLKIFGIISSLILGIFIQFCEKLIVHFDETTLFELNALKLCKRYFNRFFVIIVYILVLPAISIFSIKLYNIIKQKGYFDITKDFILNLRNIIEVFVQEWIREVPAIVDKVGESTLLVFKVIGFYIFIVFAIILLRIIGYIRTGKIRGKFAFVWILFYCIVGSILYGKNGLISGFLFGTVTFIYLAHIIVYWKYIIPWTLFCGVIGFYLFDTRGLVGGLLLGILTFISKE